MTEFTRYDDIIDSRDIIVRIETLEGLSADDLLPEDVYELEKLKALEAQCKPYAEDWDCGVTLIRHTYFATYCEELVKDIGDLPKTIPAYIEIDWDATAENLRVDYTEVDFDGVSYFVR